MTIKLITTATGLQLATESTISWEHPMVGPVNGGAVLLALIGAVDSEVPNPVLAVFSGTALTPLDAVPMATVANINGIGGQSFPCGFIFAAVNPVSVTGTVTGTITIAFDQEVGTMQGMSVVFSGGDGTFDNGLVHQTINTDLPDFDITNPFTTTATGSLVVDMCISESSNHNNHKVPSAQMKFADLSFSGPRVTATYSGIADISTIEMGRLEAGGPFAGVTLITFALKL